MRTVAVSNWARVERCLLCGRNQVKVKRIISKGSLKCIVRKRNGHIKLVK